jgi:hypothetical protein
MSKQNEVTGLWRLHIVEPKTVVWQKHTWCSGNINASHALAPISIIGVCIALA